MGEFFELTDRENEFTAIEFHSALMKYLIWNYEIFFENIQPYILIRAVQIFYENNEGIRIRLVERGEGLPFSQTLLDPLDISFETAACAPDDGRYEKIKEQFCNREMPYTERTASFLAVFFPDGSARLIVRLNHINMDYTAVSTAIGAIRHIAEELAEKGNTSYSAPSFLQYCSERREYLKSRQYERDAEFWREYLDCEYEIGRMPGTPFGQEIAFSGKEFPVTEETFHVRELAEIMHLSLDNMIFTLFGLTMARYTESRAFSIRRAYSNRFRKEKDLYAVTRAIVPVIFRVGETFADACQKIGEDSLSMARHTRIPLSRIRQFQVMGRVKRGHVSDAMADSDFTFNAIGQEQGERIIAVGDENEWESEPGQNLLSTFNLYVVVIHHNEEVTLRFFGVENALQDNSSGGAARSFEDLYHDMVEICEREYALYQNKDDPESAFKTVF